MGLILFAFASSTWMMFAFLVPYCLGGIAGPALQATLAGHIPPNQQGELQGALTSLMSITTIIGPPMMNNLFFQFTKASAPVHFPGVSFLLAALFMLLSLLITWYVLSNEAKKKIPAPDTVRENRNL
jgi:DHA1 family tetracycline resistance protein-like MFS transporter